jgi:hypothetical protein
MQNRSKVTVWCGETATSVFGPYLLRDNTNSERNIQMLQDYVWATVSARKTSTTLFSCRMVHRLTLQMPYLLGWMRSFRDVGWDDADLTNGLQEVHISQPVEPAKG